MTTIGRDYEMAVDRAYRIYGAAMFGAMSALAMAPLRDCIPIYNDRAGEARRELQVSLNQAYGLRTAGRTPHCEACLLPMDVLEEGQRFHPLCDPEPPRASSEVVRDTGGREETGDDLDW